MTSQQKGSPNEIDVYVGRRARLLRKVQGVSQSDLGDRIGVTFQQIQKYERGTNRISASMLFKIADALDVRVAYFFEGLPGQDGVAGDPAGRGIIDQLLDAPGGRDLAEAFMAMRNRHIQRSLVALVKVLAANDAELEET